MRLRPGLLFGALLLSVPLPAAAQDAAGSPVCPEVVTIESGDTLGAIAGRCGTTVEAIRNANPDLGDPRRLRIGTEVRVPASSEAPATAGDASGRAAAGDAAGYVIRQGDTWDSIAQETGVGVEALMEANPDLGSVALNAGSRIAIPSREEAKGPPPELARAGTVAGAETNEGSRVTEGMQGGETSMGLRVVGRLTEEGVECPALRSLDGTLYTLAGNIQQFEPGDQVVVTGSKAETSTCMQGITINVEKIAPAS